MRPCDGPAAPVIVPERGAVLVVTLVGDVKIVGGCIDSRELMMQGVPTLRFAH